MCFTRVSHWFHIASTLFSHLFHIVGHVTGDTRHRTWDAGHGTWATAYRARDTGHGTGDRGHKTRDTPGHPGAAQPEEQQYTGVAPGPCP